MTVKRAAIFVVYFYSVIRPLIIMMQSTAPKHRMPNKLHERSEYFTNGRKIVNSLTNKDFYTSKLTKSDAIFFNHSGHV